MCIQACGIIIAHESWTVRNVAANAVRGFREEITRINNPEVRGVQ
mgnify:CR=1 FL=1